MIEGINANQRKKKRIKNIKNIESEWTKTHEIVKFIIVKTCIIYVTSVDHTTYLESLITYIFHYPYLSRLRSLSV